jgi:hypothetical protein
MSIEVLIEPLPNNGFRATSGGPLALSVEAPSRDQALALLKKQLRARLRNGAELVPVDMEAETHPWMEFAGMHDPNDPAVQEWGKSMAEYRRTIDEHPELP